MTIEAAFANLVDPTVDITGIPEAEFVVAPSTIPEVEQILDLASEHTMPTTVWGGGTHQGYGHRVATGLVVSTQRMNRLVDWQPEDLTVTAEAGMRVADLESMLAERGQTAVLPELPGDATLGGVVAAGVSGWRRSRYGPTRERVLEADLVTGDGRHVRSGGRVVKNVTGFDLARLSVGSLGALGFIAQVCLKLWPLPAARATVSVEDGDAGLDTAYRPQAVVETNGRAQVFLGGTEPEVAAQTGELGGSAEVGWIWPEEPTNSVRWSLRVPPSMMRHGIDRLPQGWMYQAGLGTGEIRCASDDGEHALDVRAWAESVGGALVLVDGPSDLYEQIDPWGTAPNSINIQRRLIDRFDPLRVLNPGRLPGGI